jgi:hypothetical protein
LERLKKAKELGIKGYSKAKEYTNKQIHDQKKKVALDVIDKTINDDYFDTKKGKTDLRHIKVTEELVQRLYADGGMMAKGGIIDLGKELTKYSSKKIEYWASYIMTSEKEQNDKIEYLEDFMEKNKLYSDLVFEGGFVGLGFNFKGTKKDLIEKLSMVSNEMKKINVSGDLAPINKTPKSVYDDILMYGENRYADGGTMAKGGKIKKYELGDMYSEDFNYNGMLKMGMNARITWGLEKLQALSDSFEDVNYHTENIKLREAIDFLKKGNELKAKQALGSFNLKCRSELGNQGFAKGGKTKKETMTKKATGAKKPNPQTNKLKEVIAHAKATRKDGEAWKVAVARAWKEMK